MLTSTDIEDLIHVRLPETIMRNRLAALTPLKLDSLTLRALVGALRGTLEKAVEGLSQIGHDTIDCCGTGGSGITHFNTSTAAAFVLAAGGVKVTKFGNRAMSGKSGSFDLLNALGFPASVPVEIIPDLLDKNGLVFLFAPQFYPALAGLAPIRNSLGVATVFNFIGPLLNPVNPAYRLMGVSDPIMVETIADYLSSLPSNKRSLLVRSARGLDEIDYDGLSRLQEVSDSQINASEICTQFHGIEIFAENVLKPEDNRLIFEGIIDGGDRRSIYHRMICLNAGAGFYISGHARSINEGSAIAEDLLAKGAVQEKVNRLRRSYARYAS